MSQLFVLLHILSAIALYCGLAGRSRFRAIPLYLLPARRRRDQAAAEAGAAGQVTPALQAALADGGVAAYRSVELVVVVVITVLRVLKPF